MKVRTQKKNKVVKQIGKVRGNQSGGKSLQKGGEPSHFSNKTFHSPSLCGCLFEK